MPRAAQHGVRRTGVRDVGGRDGGQMGPFMTRRRFLTLAAGGATIGVAPTVVNPEQVSSKERLRGATGLRSALESLGWTATETGIFNRLGLERVLRTTVPTVTETVAGWHRETSQGTGAPTVIGRFPVPRDCQRRVVPGRTGTVWLRAKALWRLANSVEPLCAT